MKVKNAFTVLETHTQAHTRQPLPWAPERSGTCSSPISTLRPAAVKTLTASRELQRLSLHN